MVLLFHSSPAPPSPFSSSFSISPSLPLPLESLCLVASRCRQLQFLFLDSKPLPPAKISEFTLSFISTTSIIFLRPFSPFMLSLFLIISILGNHSVTAIAHHCVGLTGISLEGLRKVNDISITLLASQCHHVTYLNLRSCIFVCVTCCLCLFDPY